VRRRTAGRYRAFAVRAARPSRLFCWLRSRKAAKAHKNLLHIDSVEKHMRAVDVKHKPEGLLPVCALPAPSPAALHLLAPLSMYACDSHICNAPCSAEAPLVPKMCVDG
jgi:hypothetical protein